jgi:glycosyltransferase involved in cell wall biosynthesis
MTPASKRSCIITSEIVGPFKNGGIGTHCFYLAKFLSRSLQQDVTLAYTGILETKNEAYWQEWFQREMGVRFVWIPEPAKDERPIATWNCQHARIARSVFEWLRGQAFDVCYFQEMLGNGYRCFQAKRLGLAFRDTVLTCTFHSSWDWISQAMQLFPTYGGEELQTKYMERYCMENCDIAISPSDYMFQWARANGIALPANHRVLPYLLDSGLSHAGYDRPGGKIIFFGRLETRKGLILFLETLCEIERRGNLAGRQLEVTLLGRIALTPDGNATMTVEKYLPRLSQSIRVVLKTDLGHQEAHEFLRANRDALVVCPSLVDNSPFAVIECLQLGVNIIAAKSGGIPELFADDARLFEPEPEAFAEKIEAALLNRLPPPVKRYDAERAARLWSEFVHKTASEFRPGTAPAGSPRVQVIVGADGSEADLRATLSALQQQTFTDQPVTVVHRRTAHASAAAFAEARKIFGAPTWSFIELDAPSSPVAIAEGVDFVAFLGPHCVPKPQWLERMVAAIHFRGLDALTCCAEIPTEGDPGPSLHLHEALGACIEVGVYANMFGLECILMKAAVAPTNATGVCQVLSQDGVWTFVADLLLSGKQCDAHPDVLVRVTPPLDAMIFGNPNYSVHAEVLQHFAHGFPDWVGRLLTNAVGSVTNISILAAHAQRVATHAENVAAHAKNVTAHLTAELELARKRQKEAEATPSIRRLFSKIRREGRRVFKQIKNLCIRRDGPPAGPDAHDRKNSDL